MMVELGREKRQSIRALCEGNREVLVRGAAEGTMGRVWTPGLEDASYCLVGSGDFAFLLGLPPKGPRALDLKSQLYQSAARAFIYPENEMWEQWLLQEFDGQLRRVTRYALKKDEHHFDQDRLKANVKAVPQGIRIRRIDERLYHLAMKEEWSRDLCSNFEDYKHFSACGFGYGAMKIHKLVAGCSAYGVSEGMMEIQVDTRKDFRRQGLALACSSAFVLECLQKELIPNWDAANQQSVELAEKLGYVFEREYQVYQLL